MTLCETVPWFLIDWLSLSLSPIWIPEWQRTKVTPKKGKEECVWKVKTRAQVPMWSWHLQAPVDPPVLAQETPSQPSGVEQKDRGGRVTGTGGEVTRVIAKLTFGPDGCGGWAIYVGQGGTSSQETPTYHGRQGPPEGIHVGCTTKEAPESTDWGWWLFMQDQPVPKEHGAPYS